MGHSFQDGGRLFLAQFERKTHIFAHRHVRIKGITLEHHGNIAVLGLQMIDHLLVDFDFTSGNVFQTRQHAQQGRFTATRGPHQDDELTRVNIEADAMDDLDLLAIHLFDLME